MKVTKAFVLCTGSNGNIVPEVVCARVCVCVGGGGLVSTCVGVWIDSRSVLPSEGSISPAGVWVLSGLPPDPSRVPHFRNMTEHMPKV
jgi:hypothetical protein